jgi:hypothetical protein
VIAFTLPPMTLAPPANLMHAQVEDIDSLDLDSLLKNGLWEPWPQPIVPTWYDSADPDFDQLERDDNLVSWLDETPDNEIMADSDGAPIVLCWYLAEL